MNQARGEQNLMAEDVLVQHACRQGDRIAVIDDRPEATPRQQTFHELNRYVNQIANGLVSSGVDAGDKVMWLGQNSLEVVAFTHAARKIGVVSVPLNYRLSDDEAVYVINDSDSVVLFADMEFAGFVARIRPRLDTLRDVVIFAGPGPVDDDGRPVAIEDGQIAERDWLGGDHEPPVRERPAAIMIYTSGTTGRPKGAYRTVRFNSEQRLELLRLFGFGPDDIYVTCGPLYHSGPGAFAAHAFSVGATVVVQHRFDAEDWLRLVDTYRASITFSAPTPIRMVLSLPDDIKSRYDTSSMRVMVANAAPWPFALKEAYLEDFPPDSLWEVYGSTELGINTILEPADQLRKPGSCGKPAPLVDIALFDEKRQLIEDVGVSGELFVRASSVFDTYYKAQSQFDEDDFEGWHTVGDIAYVDEEGFYYICDRKNDTIISGGMSIYPAEIEAALEEHPGVYEAAVVGVPSEEWGETVLAVIVASDPTLSPEELTAHCGVRLAGYKKPRRFEFVSEIPKTGSNKILRRQLRERFAAPQTVNDATD